MIRITGLFLFGVVFLWLLFSCDKNKTLQATMEKFVGNEVVFPNIWQQNETVDAKLIIWFDSTECGSCRMNRLYEWENDPVMHYAQALKDRFDVILVFSPKKQDVRSLKFALEGYDVSFPVIIDENGDMPRLNPDIPEDKRFHSFLLDKDNNVVLVGNPLGNEKLWELYKEQVRTLIK